MNALPKIKLELSDTTDPVTNEVLHFAFRGETIDEVLKEWTLDEARSHMDRYRVTFQDGEVLTLFAGPQIERQELLNLLASPCTLVKWGELPPAEAEKKAA